MTRLLSYTKFPPGGFWYHQTQGIYRIFPAEGGLRQIATRVHEFRVANHLERPTWEECFADIEAFTVARLGNDPMWVTEGDGVTSYSPPARQRAGGGCCGAEIA